MSRGRLAALLGFTAATRVAYLAFAWNDPGTALLHDAARYHAWATAWAKGAPFVAGAFDQAPLYPALLSLLYRVTGTAPHAVWILQSLLGLATVALAHRIARRAYGGNAALAAAGLAALYGMFPFYETKILPATLTTFLAGAAIERLQAAQESERSGRWIAAGLVAGIAATANASFLLAAAAATIWVVSRRRPRQALIFAAATALAIAPVTLANRAASGEWVLVATNGGITFWQGNNPEATGVFSRPRGFTGSVATQREEARAIAEDETHAPLSDAAVSSFWFRKGLRFLAEDPSRAAGLIARKAVLTLASEEQPLEYNPRLDDNPMHLLLILPFGAILGLACARFFARATDRGAETPILIVAAAQGAILLLFYVSGRYRLPATPALLAMAGAGAAAIYERRRRGGRWLVAPFTLAVVVTAISLAIVPLFWSDLRAFQTSMGWSDRGASLRGANRLADAEAAYRKAIAADATYPYAHLDLGKALRAAGRRAEADKETREAIRLAPEIAEAWLDLGAAAYADGRLDEAEHAFSEALRLDPGDAAAANNLLGTRWRMGRVAEARALRDEMRRRGLTVDEPLERMLSGAGSR